MAPKTMWCETDPHDVSTRYNANTQILKLNSQPKSVNWLWQFENFMQLYERESDAKWDKRLAGPKTDNHNWATQFL